MHVDPVGGHRKREDRLIGEKNIERPFDFDVYMADRLAAFGLDALEKCDFLFDAPPAEGCELRILEIVRA